MIVSTGGVGSGIGAEHLNGSKLRYLAWIIPQEQSFAEFWSASHSGYSAQALIVGNNGYIMPKYANLIPATTVDNTWVPRGQRPALDL